MSTINWEICDAEVDVGKVTLKFITKLLTVVLEEVLDTKAFTSKAISSMEN
jgi:hypothetical protein